MQPRVIFRTHYQVDEPAYMEFLIQSCTSPTKSNYREVAAQKLAKVLQSKKKGFNEAAGGYAVDLAQNLQILTDQNTWTDKGQLVALIAEIPDGDLETQLKLNESERLLHFKLFMEADGAALLFLARRILQDGALGNSGSSWNQIAQEMFVESLSQYLKLTASTTDRVRLRAQFDRIKDRPYEGKTGSHKIFLHTQVLYRLGLIRKEDAQSSRRYSIPENGDEKRSLEALTALIPDIAALEQVAKANTWIELASSVFFSDASALLESDNSGREKALRRIFDNYQRVMKTGVPLCALSTLLDSVQIESLVADRTLIKRETVLDLLETAQKENQKLIRFHVDRRGRPAFVRISQEFLTEHARLG